MKILILGPFPPPLFGVSLSNFVLSKGLIKRGYRVDSVNTAGGEKIDSEMGSWDIENYLLLNITLVYIRFSEQT